MRVRPLGEVRPNRITGAVGGVEFEILDRASLSGLVGTWVYDNRDGEEDCEELIELIAPFVRIR
jgi:hypothetical protein